MASLEISSRCEWARGLETAEVLIGGSDPRCAREAGDVALSPGNVCLYRRQHSNAHGQTQKLPSVRRFHPILHESVAEARWDVPLHRLRRNSNHISHM